MFFNATLVSDTLNKMLQNFFNNMDATEIKQISTAWIELQSAGPLEDLLVSRGKEFIDKIEIEAKANHYFAILLEDVWPGRIDDNVWKRIQAVCDRKYWDEADKANNKNT